MIELPEIRISTIGPLGSTKFKKKLYLPSKINGFKAQNVLPTPRGDPGGVSETDWLILLRAVAARRALFYTAFSAPVRSEVR